MSDAWQDAGRHWHCFTDTVRIRCDVTYTYRADYNVMHTPDEVADWLNQPDPDPQLHAVNLVALRWGRTVGRILPAGYDLVTRLHAMSVGPTAAVYGCPTSGTNTICNQHQLGD